MAERGSLSAAFLGCASVLAVLGCLFSGLFAGLGVYWALRAQPDIPAAPTLAADERWDGKKTLSCRGAESVEVIDMKVKLKGTAIRARGNCTVEIRNSTIEATTALDVAGNAKVVARGSRLKGSKWAIKTRDAATVRMLDSQMEGGLALTDQAKILFK